MPPPYCHLHATYMPSRCHLFQGQDAGGICSSVEQYSDKMNTSHGVDEAQQKSYFLRIKSQEWDYQVNFNIIIVLASEMLLKLVNRSKLLHQFHFILVKIRDFLYFSCFYFSFCSSLYVNLLSFYMDLEKAEESEINCQHLLDHRESKGIPEKHLLLLH